MSDPQLPEEIGHLLFKRAADLTFNAVTVTRATDDEGGSEIIYVNHAFTEMTGYAASEVVGETPGMLQGPATEDDELDRLERLAAGETFHGQTVNYRKDGTPFEIEWKVRPIQEGKQTTHYVAVQREVTER